MSIALVKCFIGKGNLFRGLELWDLIDFDVPFCRHLLNKKITLLLRSRKLLNVGPENKEEYIIKMKSYRRLSLSNLHVSFKRYFNFCLVLRILLPSNNLRVLDANEIVVALRKEPIFKVKDLLKQLQLN